MTTDLTPAFITEELARVSRCVDFRHERLLRSSSTTIVENLNLARSIIGAHGLKSFGAVECLKAADAAIEELREDILCLDLNLRRHFFDNCDDAQDSIRTFISLAE